MGDLRERPRRKRSYDVLGFVGVLLPVLKLAGVIGWSWWLVLLPLWLPAAVLLLFTAVFLMSAGRDRLSEQLTRWRIRRMHRNDNGVALLE